MPKVLQFTLRPHYDVWPNDLCTDSTFDLGIALYFLPIEFCRTKNKYSGLVELMEKEDLILQSHLNGVNLLIFTSRRLPFDAQGMKGQVYLWGMFLSSTGWHSPVGLRVKQYTFDFPPPNYGIGENSVNVYGSDNEVVDMENDMVGGKEVEDINRILGSNSIGTCTSSLNTTSQGVHRVYQSTTTTILHRVKQEPCDDIYASPGLFRIYSNHPFREASVTNTAAVLGPIPISHVQMPPICSSELLKLNQWDSSSKQPHSVSNTNLVGSSSFCNTSITPYQLPLPSDRVNSLPLASDKQDGRRRINAPRRVPHQKSKRFQTRFTREQKDKMLTFGEKVGWSLIKQEEAVVQKFCQEIGVGMRRLQVWMYNKKHELKIRSSAYTRESHSPDRPNLLRLWYNQGGGDGGGDIIVAKRFKSKFTQEQKDKMWSFAEKVRWSMPKQEDVVHRFCEEVGITSRVLKSWMCNTKHNLKLKVVSSSAT